MRVLKYELVCSIRLFPGEWVASAELDCQLAWFLCVRIDKSFEKVVTDCGRWRRGGDKTARHTEMKQVFAMEMYKEKDEWHTLYFASLCHLLHKEMAHVNLLSCVKWLKCTFPPLYIFKYRVYQIKRIVEHS